MDNLNIDKKISSIKNSIKELQNIFFTLYRKDEEDKNNKLIFIKRNIDKIKSASKYLIALRFEEKESSILEKEIIASHKNISKQILELDRKLNALYDLNSNNNLNGYVSLLKSNLDNLRLGSNCLKKIDIDELVNEKRDKS